MSQSLFEKVWDSHAVKTLSNGQTQLLIGTHLIHEVTSPQAFGMLRDLGLKVKYPERTFATVDHIVPTKSQVEPFEDGLAQEMINALRDNCKEFGVKFFDIGSGGQGIVHVVGPEQGITQPGTTIACGDSHTATHGAFGAIAFGIGTTQIRDVLATQTMALSKLKVRRINVDGELPPGVYAKDVVLHIIKLLGAKGGIGYAYEYGGSLFDNFSMEERMTVCNMSIEGGARCGYVNPDQTTYEYLRGREFAPDDAAWDSAVAYWESVRSDPDAEFDDVVVYDGGEIEPMVTWGITPGQSTTVNGTLPEPESFSEDERGSIREAYEHMDFHPGRPIKGTKIDVAFLGSCTNGRLSDIEEVVRMIDGKGFRVAEQVKTLVVPGSQQVRREVIERGWDRILQEAGFDFREAGCSMCLAMNLDKLEGRQVCASSSNRNFKGRQGSPTGRTLLMSPVMVAASAIAGEVTDAREMFEIGQ